MFLIDRLPALVKVTLTFKKSTEPSEPYFFYNMKCVKMLDDQRRNLRKGLVDFISGTKCVF